MSDAEKQELAELVAAAVARTAARTDCALGIDAATARELISFAETWRTCRRQLLIGALTTALGGLALALWVGIKTALRR